MTSPVAVSVVLPTYNEAENISELVDQVASALRGFQTEMIVVDDDSPDGTWRIVRDGCAATPGLRLIHRVGRRGLTSALTEGIAAARGQIVCWMDCDLSMPAAALPRLVAKVSEGYDLAVGSRFVEGGKDDRVDVPMRRLASRAVTGLASLLLVRGFRDYTSGFIAVRRQVLDAIPLRGDYGEYFIDLIYRAHRRGYRIVEVPYVLADRRRGQSKTRLGFFRKGAKYLALIARLRLEGP